MRNIRLILIASLLVAAAAGCSSSSDSSGTGGSGGYAPFVPPTNGVAMNEEEACEALVEALSNEANALPCVLTLPTCPDYIRRSGAPVCSQYDEGSILGCAEFYGTYTSCADFANRPCQIHNFANSEPNGCPADDAGVDAEPDATDTDATDTDATDTDATDTDAMDTDAGTPDAEPDSAVEPDAQDDAAAADDAPASD